MALDSVRSGHPSAAEVRAALERIVANPTFRASSQLAAFLRFVVEAALAGQSDRIKGYTIAVEALGRSADFDPQTDPIVRVEAGRLRRALERYYGNGGASDPIAIELPRGSYAPTFHYRSISISRLSDARLRKFALAIPPAARRYAAAIGLVLTGAAIFGAIDFLMIDETLVTRATHRAATTAPVRLTSYVGPVLYVEPITTVGVAGPNAVSTESLRERLRDSFARFDEVTIVAERAKSDASASAGERHIPPADYSFATTAEYHPDGTVSLTFRLLDSADSIIVWSKTYDHLKIADTPGRQRYPFVGQVAAMLFQPFGVVHARERAKQIVGNQGDERYRCLLDAHEYLRSYNPALHTVARNCLEKAVVDDPIFASGYATLARVYLREHQFSIEQRAGDAPPLDRALRAA